MTYFYVYSYLELGELIDAVIMVLVNYSGMSYTNMIH